MNRMTLLEYIECQNIKRKIKSKTKSKNKQAVREKQRQKSPITSNIQYSNSQKQKGQVKTDLPQQKSSILQIDSKLSLLSQSLQIDSFVVINVKIDEIKQFVRQKVQDDKSFAAISKMLGQLQQILRLQIMKTYRLQLYKFQFQNQKKMNEQMNLILTELNNKYIDSQIKYKRSLQKGKSQLDSKQKKLIASIHEIGSQNNLNLKTQNNLQLTKSITQSQFTTQSVNKLPQLKMIHQKKMSFLDSIIARGQEISNQNAAKRQIDNKIAQRPPKQSIQLQIKPGQKTRKVKWTQVIQQKNQQYALPSFLNRPSQDDNPINKHDQSNINIHQDSLQQRPNNGKQSLNLNMPINIMHLLRHTESKQMPADIQKKQQIKQSIKQSKDYLRLERSPTQKNPSSKSKKKRSS